MASNKPKPQKFEVRSQSTAGYEERNTFSRGKSIDIYAIRRTLTSTLGIDPDTEEAWTKSIIHTYREAAKKGVQGDIPLPPPFANDRNFWINFLMSGVLGGILGLCALGYLNFTDKMPKLWANGWVSSSDDTRFICSNTVGCTKYENADFYTGEKTWIIITTVTGLIVGLIRFFSKYPEDLPGLFKEIHSYHVEPKWAPWSFLISLISLAGGACLGPEQALGNLGGGITTYISEHYYKFANDDDRKLFVLGGMASALGALFPTPMLGVLMLHELGEPPKSYMESTLVLSAGAVSAFLVYYSLVNESFIASLSRNGIVLSYAWEFGEINCITAFFVGIFGAILGIVTMLFIGITKQILNRIRLRLQERNLKFLYAVLPSVIAGVCIGCVNWALPLTVGNGNMVISSIITYGYQNQLSTHLLVCTMFARMFCLGVSMNGGFVGGFIFPMITIGVIAGMIWYQIYPCAPIGLLIGCFLASVPAAICPMPFTLAALSIFIFFFGLYQTVPIFIASITSYTLVVGSGLFEFLQKRGQAGQQQEEDDDVEKDRSEALKIAESKNAMHTTEVAPSSTIKSPIRK